jgi:hypothetical protein
MRRSELGRIMKAMQNDTRGSAPWKRNELLFSLAWFL